MAEERNPLKDIRKNRRKHRQKGPNQRLRQRAAVLIIIILVLGFGATLLRLGILTVVRGSDLQERAVGQQLADTTLTAKRGAIYDAGGNVACRKRVCVAGGDVACQL